MTESVSFSSASEVNPPASAAESISVNSRYEPSTGSDGVVNCEATNRGVDNSGTGGTAWLPDVTGMTRTGAAQAYMEAGVFVFPVDGKLPAKLMGGRMKWATESTTDPGQHARWSKAIWAPSGEHLTHRRGMAVDLGKTGAVVVDVDRPELVPDEWWAVLETAPFVSTDTEDPRRGHYYFAQPPGLIGCPKGEWGEIKGVGGYVILPPSPHACAHLDWPDGQTPEGKYRPTARYLQVRTGVMPVLPELIADTFGEHRQAQACASAEDVRAFMETYQGGEGEDPALLGGIVDYFVKASTGARPKGRHPVMVGCCAWAAKAAKGGLLDAEMAKDALYDAFRHVLPLGPDARLEMPGEFDGMWEWGIGQATDEAVAEYLAKRAMKSDAYFKEKYAGAPDEPAFAGMLDADGHVIDRREAMAPVRAPATVASTTNGGSDHVQSDGTGGGGTEGSRIIFRRASDVRLRRTEWLWDTTPEGGVPTSGGRIPKDMLTVAAGLPGTGKSQWAIWVTSKITRGTLPGSEYGTPKNVVYAATEDDWERTIAPRLVAAGADLDRVFHVAVQTVELRTLRLSVPEHVKELGEFAQQENVALVVLDPLLSHLGGKINANAEKEVRDALEPLTKAAAKYCFTVLGLSHFNKNSGNADPMERLMGSRGFSALLRALIVFAKDKDAEEGDTEVPVQKFVLSQAKNNLGRTDMPSYSYTILPTIVETEEGDAYVSRFALGPESDTSVEEQLATAGRNPEDAALGQDCKAWLKGYLQDHGGEDYSKDIIKAAEKEGYSRATLYRARTALKIPPGAAGFGSSKVSMWRLPGAVTGGPAAPVAPPKYASGGYAGLLGKVDEAAAREPERTQWKPKVWEADGLPDEEQEE